DQPRPAGLHNHARADRHGVDRARDLDQKPAYAHHAAVDLDLVELGDLLGQRLHETSPETTTTGDLLTGHLPASLILASPSLGPSRLRFQHGGASRRSRLPLTLNVEREQATVRKTPQVQHITAIRSLPPSKC